MISSGLLVTSWPSTHNNHTRPRGRAAFDRCAGLCQILCHVRSMRSIRCRARRIIACIGSMYGIYGNIYHQYTPNVSIYTIHPMGHETHETQSWVAQIACHPTASRKWRQKLWKQSPGKLAPPTVHPWPKRKKRNRGFPIDISTMCNWYQWIIYSLITAMQFWYSYAIVDVWTCMNHNNCFEFETVVSLATCWLRNCTTHRIGAPRRSQDDHEDQWPRPAWKRLGNPFFQMIVPWLILVFPIKMQKKHENCHELGVPPYWKSPISMFFAKWWEMRCAWCTSSRSCFDARGITGFLAA